MCNRDGILFIEYFFQVFKQFTKKLHLIIMNYETCGLAFNKERRVEFNNWKIFPLCGTF